MLHGEIFANFRLKLYLSLMSRATQTGTSSVTSDLDFSSTRLVTDSALENITEWRQFSGEDMFRSKLRLQIRIDDFRKAQGGLTNRYILFIIKKINRLQNCMLLVVCGACLHALSARYGGGKISTD